MNTASACAWVRWPAVIGEIETWAAASAGASLSPSPTISARRPVSRKRSSRAILSAGFIVARNSLMPSSRAASATAARRSPESISIA